jgi:hypothetical protein
MTPKNRIEEILNIKGFKNFTPTDQILKDFDMSLHRFNKIIGNRTEATTTELQMFSIWLDTPIQNLLILKQDERKNQLVTP